MASADLSWLIVRNNNAFLLKRNKISMSLEPNNVKSRNSFRYNGFIHKKTVGVEPAKDGKGVVLVTRKAKTLRKPGKSLKRVELKKDARRTIRTIRNSIQASGYRNDLGNAAIRRACAILKSQRPVVITNKGRAKKD